MIEKMYGGTLFQYDAINDLFPENYEAAVKEAGIEVVGRPDPRRSSPCPRTRALP